LDVRVKKDRYLESVAAHFLLLPSYRRFPLEDEFQRELQAKDLYNFRIKNSGLPENDSGLTGPIVMNEY